LLVSPHAPQRARKLVTRRSTVVRLVVALLATVQLLLPTVAAWADAAIEREALARSAPQIHVEAHSFNGCERIHAADCALCHAAFSSFTRPAQQPLAFSARRRAQSVPAAGRSRACSTDIVWNSQPRAPPGLA
jgi:uncharacterized membrane protein